MTRKEQEERRRDGERKGDRQRGSQKGKAGGPTSRKQSPNNETKDQEAGGMKS